MYKENVEKLFREGKANDAWGGVKTLAGLSNNNSSSPSYGASDPASMAVSLNHFYSRFDHCDYSRDRGKHMDDFSHGLPTQANLELQQGEVELTMKRMRPNKAPGPDQICGQLLKACCSQLAGVFCHLFNCSLSEHSIPSL